jgi:putative pyrroloquinoline-quinone binding quinoprotein
MVAPLLLALTLTVQQTAPAWRFTSPDTLGAAEMTPLGTLAVQTTGGLVVLDVETGQTTWTRADTRAFDLVPFTPFGVVQTDRGLELIDMETGITRWAFRSLPLTQVRSYVPIPERALVLVYGVVDTNPLVVLAVGLDSGIVRWRQDGLFDTSPWLSERRPKITLARFQPVLWDSDTTMVLYPSHGGPMKIDARTGALLWRADTLRDEKTPALSDGYSPMLLDGGRIYVPYGKRLMALDAATGRVLWDREKQFEGVIRQIQPTARGLLVGGLPKRGDRGTWKVPKPFMDLVDPETGTSRWEKPFNRLDDATRFGIIGDTAFLAAKDKLFAVDLKTGTAREVIDLQFQGGDSPYTLEALEEGFLLVGRQNLALIDTLSREKYHVYHPAVGASLLAKIASTALIVAANVASAAIAQGQANRTGGVVMYPMITSNPVLSARFTASQLAESYHFLFTSGKGDDLDRHGFSFVRIDKRDGREAGRVWVEDRSPDYVLDSVTPIVFLWVSKHELQALRF